jgi:integrase
MKGYVVRKGNQHYAVIYEGFDPLTGRERRRWHSAGPDRDVAEQLAVKLADEQMRDRSPRRSSLTVAVYLTQRWLPANQARLRPSTWAGYARNTRLHVVPRIGRVPLRHLRPDHIERMYADLSVGGNHTRDGGLDEKTIIEVHQMLRRSLDDAVRRGLLVANPAAVALAPRRRPIGSSSVAKAWNAYQLRAFLDHTAGHRMHAALWTAANTGMRRSELAGFHWGDIDLDERRLSVNRSLVSVGYELHEFRGKTRTSRRCIDLDSTTVQVLRGWRSHRAAEDPSFDPGDPDAYVFARPDGTRVHPQLISDAFKRKVRTSGLPRVRLHDFRHTHATGSTGFKAGVPIKVVSERLGHSSPAFTMAPTYQHVLPGMQREAAETFASLLELLPASTR